MVGAANTLNQPDRYRWVLNQDIWEEVSSVLGELGAKYGAVSLSHLPEIRNRIEGLRERGMLDRDLQREYLGGFRFQVPSRIPGAKAVIVVAYPHPQHTVRIRAGGKSLDLTIPPTYILYRKREREILACISGVLGRAGFGVLPTGDDPLPLKMLAARSGLGEYGRNNICYVPGFGSFHRLAGFYTDLPLAEDNWREPRVMAECRDCERCMRACPSGAISDDRFLLHAERCLTFHSERTDPFPDWIDTSWYTCLVGCMACQRACPENRDVLEYREEALDLSDEETEDIMNIPYEGLPRGLRDRIEDVDMEWLMDVLPRNMRILLEKMARKS